MKRRIVIGMVSASVLLFAGLSNSHTDTSLSEKPVEAVQATTEPAPEQPKKIIPTCDGTTVTSSCTTEGVIYTKYVYHPSVAERVHTETVTTYHEEITGYCTLCDDGTYSPSCATGRGACSHHGGVAQWNAPVTESVPVTTNKTVVDSPAIEAYYEKETE